MPAHKPGRSVALTFSDAYREHHLSERLAYVEGILEAGETTDLFDPTIKRRLTKVQRQRYETERAQLKARLEETNAQDD